VTTHTEAPPIYEMVTDKPQPAAAAYRVRDYRTDPTVDIKDEARRCASLPTVRIASVEYDSRGTSRLIVESFSGETVGAHAGGWLVARPTELGPHPADKHLCFQCDLSGALMVYTDAQYRDRYL